MRIFTSLYDRALLWSQHSHAPWYLAGLSFAESSFFPVPPDVMLAPMVLATPKRGLWLGLLTTIMSVLGGIAGWSIGYFGFEAAEGMLQAAGYMDEYARVSEWFGRWGFLAVLLAGFSPVPYKIFTIAAGSLAMPLPLFVVASAIGRGARFFLVSLLIMSGGEHAAEKLRAHIETIGWTTVVLAVGVYLWVR
ncbi:MAG: DedA family protein [Gammaproteobacteria bacterium]|nr:DedA family protein [Gammaproteobacteria bacterium]